MPSKTEPGVETAFAGQRLVLDSTGAMFLPEHKLLVVSDLHLEKASYLAQFGSPLPRYDTRDTLLKLAELIERYRPERLICLGDSFHDKRAFERLHEQDRAQLLQMSGALAQWDWVLGNHDPALPSELPGNMHARIMLGDLWFLHEPEEAPAQIVGHFHPKLSVGLGGHTASGRVFVHDASLFIMPSFGSYTGGLDTRHEAIASLLHSPTHYLIYRGRIWKILGAHERQEV